MKKIIKGLNLLIFIFLCNIFISNVNASSATIGVSSSAKQVVVGNTVKVYVTVSSSQPLGSWEFDMNYDSNILSFVSSNLEGNTRSAGAVNNDNTKSKKYTITFKAKKSGTATVSVKNASVYGFDENKMSVNNSSVSIKTITQKELESSYSSDNYLSKLLIEGYTLNPGFSKDTTKYSLTVENDVKSINVKATERDSKASVSGDGVRKLEEGTNKINVVVTAENGNKRTYTINVTVKELNPINIKIGDEEYTVVRKVELLTAPSTYTETVAVIDGEEVPAFKSNITNYVLVGLTDSNGNTNLYIYDEDQYILYNEYKFGGIILYNMQPDSEKMLDDLKQIELELDDAKLTAYTLDGVAYPLIYGVNVETGEENWYTYDESENTLQKYVASNSKVIEKIIEQKEENSNDKYKTLCLILGGISGILFIFLIIAAIKISVQKKTEA